MPIVYIPPPLRDLTGGAAEVAVEGTTVREVIDALDTRFPGLKHRLCRGDALAPGLQVSIDHVMSRGGLRDGPPGERSPLPAGDRGRIDPLA